MPKSLHFLNANKVTTSLKRSVKELVHDHLSLAISDETAWHYNTKRSVNAEQTHLCRYWQEQGVDKEAAYQTWVALESPQAVGVRCNQGLMTFTFSYINCAVTFRGEELRE